MRKTPTRLAEEFWRFHEANPHVYERLLQLARFVRDRGHRRRYGIAAIFERLRWISEFETVGDEYKLNNNFRAFYARLLVSEPGLEGLFEVRESKAD